MISFTLCAHFQWFRMLMDSLRGAKGFGLKKIIKEKKCKNERERNL